MMTVTISKNGNPIYARTVVNKLSTQGAYVCDDGTLIKHDPEDGMIALAIKALKTIKEVRS